MSLCQGCGTELPPQKQGYPRKWCSDRCRKAQYAGTCIDCGGHTGGSDGRGPRASKRCAACGTKETNRLQRERADEKEAEVVALYREGLTAWQIAERLGLSVPAVANCASRARRRGIDVPFAPLGYASHRRSQVAA